MSSVEPGKTLVRSSAPPLLPSEGWQASPTVRLAATTTPTRNGALCPGWYALLDLHLRSTSSWSCQARGENQNKSVFSVQSNLLRLEAFAMCSNDRANYHCKSTQSRRLAKLGCFFINTKLTLIWIRSQHPTKRRLHWLLQKEKSKKVQLSTTRGISPAFCLARSNCADWRWVHWLCYTG